MISSEVLGMLLVFIAIFGLCAIGYIYEYTRYVSRFYSRYGKRVFKRGLRYLRRL